MARQPPSQQATSASGRAWRIPLERLAALPEARDWTQLRVVAARRLKSVSPAKEAEIFAKALVDTVRQGVDGRHLSRVSPSQPRVAGDTIVVDLDVWREAPDALRAVERLLPPSLRLPGATGAWSVRVDGHSAPCARRFSIGPVPSCIAVERLTAVLKEMGTPVASCKAAASRVHEGFAAARTFIFVTEPCLAAALPPASIVVTDGTASARTMYVRRLPEAEPAQAPRPIAARPSTANATVGVATAKRQRGSGATYASVAAGKRAVADVHGGSAGGSGTAAAEQGAPVAQRDTAAAERAAPAAQRDAAAAERAAPAAQRDAAAAERNAPAAQPGAAAAERNAAAAQPGAAATERNAPAAQPGATAAERDAPAAQPDAAATERGGRPAAAAARPADPAEANTSARGAAACACPTDPGSAPAGKVAAKARRAAEANGGSAEAKRGRRSAPVVEVEDDAMLDAELGETDTQQQDDGAQRRRSRRLEERQLAASLARGADTQS